GYRNLFPKQHERRLWPLSDRIICNARILKEIMSRRHSVDPKRIAVIPNGVDTDALFPGPGPKAPEPTILFMGRLVKDKDPMTLVEAFTRVVQKIPSARLDIIGNGPLRKKLEAAVRSRSLESRVRIMPGARDIRPYLKRAWIFALAAFTGEGSPNVIIEAMAAGLPVVATRIGGNPELVVEGQTGFIVEPRDPRGLAEAMLNLLTDEKGRLAMGAKARERVLSRHSLEKVVKQT
ncbi:MAG: glycosyltransferase family 4 protein, partial [Deltaproteobacteria bacterium]|nr:glycosyltransferase family 4 protein [Deltaproteobacteria bacterium]